MRKIIYPAYVVLGKIKEVYHKRRVSEIPNGEYFSKYNIPSFTQWESKEIIEDIINDRRDCKTDPLWKNSGASSPEEYEMYSWQCCGMACLMMVLKSIYPNKNYRLVDLAKDSLAFGVYRKNYSQNIRDNLDGVIHSPFLKFIEKFDLSGRRISCIGENQLASFIHKEHFVIATVHPSIRDEYFEHNSRRGHLVLVTGFRLLNGSIFGFFINNPSGFASNQSQEKYFVPLEKWKKYFSGDANILKEK